MSIASGPSPRQSWDLVPRHRAGHGHSRVPPFSLETHFRSDFSALSGKREREKYNPGKPFKACPVPP